MDIVAHAITGLLIGCAAGETAPRKYGFWALAAAAPDLDSLSGLAGRIAYYNYHRALFHGLAGAVVLALGLGFFYRRLQLGTWRAGAAIAAIAIGSHLCLDTATSFGTELWFPFSRTPVQWDLLFMVDLMFSGVLVLLLALTWLARRRRRAGGLIAVAVIAVYLIAAAAFRDRAESAVLAAQAAGQIPPGEVIALPQPPWFGSWAVFVKADDAVWAGRVNPGTGGLQLAPYPPPTPDTLLETAVATPEARRFFAFARFPHITRSDTPEGSRFQFEDLRFLFSCWERSNRWYGVRVEVGRDGVIRYAGFANP